MVMKTPDQIDEKSFQTRKLSEAETAAAIGSFKNLESRLFRSNADHRRRTAGGSEVRGVAREHGLPEVLRRPGQAIREFSTAYDLDKQRYLSLFFKTMMSPNASSESAANVDELYNELLQVIKINPRFAEGFVRVAFVDIRKNEQTARACCVTQSRATRTFKSWLSFTQWKNSAADG